MTTIKWRSVICHDLVNYYQSINHEINKFVSGTVSSERVLGRWNANAVTNQLNNAAVGRARSQITEVNILNYRTFEE